MSNIDHKVRSRGIGSSEIAMLLGISPYGGPHALWRRKTGRESVEDSPIMERGRYLERGILDWYSDRTGRKVLDPGTIVASDGIVDSADGITEDGSRVVEAKTVHFSQHDKWGEEGTDQIPLQYLAQCHWHCGAHGVEVCDVPADFGTELRLYSVNFDREMYESWVDRALRFWRDHVLTDTPPPLDLDVSTNQWLNRNLRQSANLREASQAELAMVGAWRDAKAEIKALTEAKVELEVQIKEAIGEHEGLKSQGSKLVTYKQNKNGTRILR